MFIYEYLPVEDVKSTTHPNGFRIYHTPAGDFESVTTVLGQTLDKEWLHRWRAAIGDEQANTITAISAGRGRLIHDMVEQYIQQQPIDKRHGWPLFKQPFEQTKQILNEHITTIYAVELPLWSGALATAGRVDLVCKWDDTISIVDFKTQRSARTFKQLEQSGYFYQTCAYSLMLYERYKIAAPNLVIVSIPDDEPPSFNIQPMTKYKGITVAIFEQNKDKYNEKTL